MIGFLGKPNRAYDFVPYTLSNFDSGKSKESDRTRMVSKAIIQCAKDGKKVSEVILIAPSDALDYARSSEPHPAGSGEPSLWQEIADAAGSAPVVIGLPQADAILKDHLWTMFAHVAEQINDGDRIIFDITYSMRMFPFLAFLMIAFLRVVRKNVRVDGVYYGELVPGTDSGRLVDLTDFVRLLDWTLAADQFLKAGDGRAFAAILKNENLRAQSEALEMYAQAMLLAQAADAMKQAAAVAHIDEAHLDESLARHAPLREVLKTVGESVATHAVDEPTGAANKTRALRAQIEILRRYRDQQSWTNAALTARELMVSYACWAMKDDIWDSNSEGSRDRASKLLHRAPPLRDYDALRESLNTDAAYLRRMWSLGEDAVTSVRNAIAHTGFHKSELSGSKLAERCKSLANEVLSYFDRKIKNGEICG